MNENGYRHIGDDQLIDGLPKHMAAVARNDDSAYWEIVPGRNACATCKTLGGMRFPYRPGPVHQGCRCEIRRVAPPEWQPRIVDFGRLQGHDASASHTFLAGQKIVITFTNLGPFPAAVRARVDWTEWKATRYFACGENAFLDFSKFGDTPMTWDVLLIYLGLEGSTIEYQVYG